MPTICDTLQGQDCKDKPKSEVKENICVEDRIRPVEFESELLPMAGCSHPLDPAAIALAHQTLRETPANILASHLCKVDQSFVFGKETLEDSLPVDLMER